MVLETPLAALTSPTCKEVEMAEPTQARVRELFNYDPVSGCLIWRSRPKDAFATKAAYSSFRARCEGKAAGHIEGQGYRVIVFDGQAKKAHKLVWLFIHGEWVKYPDFEIDHVNGDRADNRIQNLRKVTKSLNQRNSSMRKNNQSGVIGVNWVASKRRWIARIWDGPHHRYLGQFTKIEDAAVARAKAERELGYARGHGKETKYS